MGDKYGNITDKMRDEWRRKIGVILEAIKLKHLFLNNVERVFVRGAEKLVEGRGLSMRQSSWLTKIYNRIE